MEPQAAAFFPLTHSLTKPFHLRSTLATSILVDSALGRERGGRGEDGMKTSVAAFSRGCDNRITATKVRNDRQLTRLRDETWSNKRHNA